MLELTQRTWSGALTSEWAVERGSVPELLPLEELAAEVGLGIVLELELGSGGGFDVGESHLDNVVLENLVPTFYSNHVFLVDRLLAVPPDMAKSA